MKKIMMLFLLASCSSLTAGNLPLETVNHVDLEHYLGKWYEIARFDQTFQKGCTASEADYSLREDGDIKVVNQCRMGSPDGELKVAEGRAWVKDQDTNAKLKVQFFLKNFKFFLFSGNYWILELDHDYQYVIIGDPSRKYLWILSRSKIMDPILYEELVAKAKAMHFDTSKLVKTLH